MLKVPGFGCTAQHLGKILAPFKPGVGDFCEYLTNSSFLDSLIASLIVKVQCESKRGEIS